jgi:hypothetical protein
LILVFRRGKIRETGNSILKPKEKSGGHFPSVDYAGDKMNCHYVLLRKTSKIRAYWTSAMNRTSSHKMPRSWKRRAYECPEIPSKILSICMFSWQRGPSFLKF